MGQDASKLKNKSSKRSNPDQASTNPFLGKKLDLAKMDICNSLDKVTPKSKCLLRLLKLERIEDYLLMEQELLNSLQESGDLHRNQEKDEEKLQTLRGSPMFVAKLKEFVDETHVIIDSRLFGQNYVPILSCVDKQKLEPGCSLLVNKSGLYVVGVLEDDADPLLDAVKMSHSPPETYADIGGLEYQIREMKESVELPMTHPEYYTDMGIKPPKGVILYGPPGTGKTLLAKAVANQTSASFFRVNGSELIQKTMGEGPKLVRKIFKMAEQHAPSIVFIDEVDAVGTKRYGTDSGGEKEIQRTLLELLNQLDGFDSKQDVKVVLATNRIETLDPALIRPGRIDRKIEFPVPDQKTKKAIFEIHTARMNLSNDITFEGVISSVNDFTGAEIKSLCMEAGLNALRDRRMKVVMDDFLEAKEKIMTKKIDDHEGMFL